MQSARLSSITKKIPAEAYPPGNNNITNFRSQEKGQKQQQVSDYVNQVPRAPRTRQVAMKKSLSGFQNSNKDLNLK